MQIIYVNEAGEVIGIDSGDQEFYDELTTACFDGEPFDVHGVSYRILGFEHSRPIGDGETRFQVKLRRW